MFRSAASLNAFVVLQRGCADISLQFYLQAAKKAYVCEEKPHPHLAFERIKHRMQLSRLANELYRRKNVKTYSVILCEMCK